MAADTAGLAGGRAERVIVISLMKSGTHLLQELMVALGYRVYGHVRITPQARPALDQDTRGRVARMVYDEGTLDRLLSEPEPVFNEAADQAWEALAWSWQLRFGMPLATWYSTALINTGLVEQACRRTAGSDFAQTPAGICWFLHEFDITKIDGHFLHEWAVTGEPRIIFNYRDPRDVVLSMVNFLGGATGRGLSAFNNLQTFKSILVSKSTLEERITYALTDDSFPCNRNDFKRMQWLLHHPDVCKTTFEELAGPQGGGTADSQLQATARLLDFLGIKEQSPQDVTGKLFNRHAFSFHRGQIGDWREAFTDKHCRLAEARFGDVLPLYGYQSEHEGNTSDQSV
jgi:hypothetical protein